MIVTSYRFTRSKTRHTSAFSNTRWGDSVPERGATGGWDTAFAGKSRTGQPAIAGKLTAGSSLNGAMVSSIM